MSSQRREGSPFATPKGRRPPSVSTVTALSESVSYDSTSDGEQCNVLTIKVNPFDTNIVGVLVSF